MPLHRRVYGLFVLVGLQAQQLQEATSKLTAVEQQLTEANARNTNIQALMDKSRADAEVRLRSHVHLDEAG